LADDNERAQGVLQGFVAVFTSLVFDEVTQLEHFADVVEIAAHPRQERVDNVH
jgi:hypothetical protein